MNMHLYGCINLRECINRYVKEEGKRIMYRLRTKDGVFPLNNLKEYGEYMVHFYGGRLIKHTEKIYIYENKNGIRYAIRIADENVVLEYKQYYAKYECQGIYIGVRKSAENRMKMNSGEVSLYVGLFDIPPVGQKVIVTPTDKRLKAEGFRI